MQISRIHHLVFAGACLGLIHCRVLAASLPAVNSRLEPVTNNYEATEVVDNYQWLENPAAPEVRDWMRLQNERTAVYFSALPYRENLARRLMQIRSDESARFGGLLERKGRIFATRFKPPAQQPVLVRIPSLDAPEPWQVVFDPNTYNAKGTTAIDWYVPSKDGKLVAISLSEGGSEQGTLHFFETDTGKELADKIPRVQFPTGGGSAAWTDDGKAILYTRYPHDGERQDADLNFYQQVWIHRIGSEVSQDKLEIGKDFPRIAEIELEAAENSPWLLATVANGDGGDFAHYLRDAEGKWQQITKFADEIKAAKLGRDHRLYLLSRQGAPHGKVLSLPMKAGAAISLEQAKLVVPQGEGVIQEFAPTEHGLYVANLLGGPSELLYYPKGSTKPKTVRTLPISSVGGLQSWHGEELIFGNVSYLKPFAWYTYDPGQASPHLTALALTSPVNFDDMEVEREFAISKDGTKVPLNIIRKKGTKLDGSHPALLTAYGGYGVSLPPGFDSTRRIWFDADGIYAVANLRGGGEYGEEWHKAGNLTRKQNVFDDFIASAEHLIKRKYTNPEKLAVEGGSNGGLLMGAFLTQRPELARVVVSHVGIYDMLRIELDPNGQFNVTEFGTVKNPSQFKALYAYSPFHHVREGVHYPAVLMTTGENDGRVNPAQSRKMTARLQAATGSDHPILFRSTANAGHGIGSSLKERIAEQADVTTFLFDQLGMSGRVGQF